MEFRKIEKYTYVEEKHKPHLEELKRFVAKSKYLPKYHIYPKCGLMNDPNGLAYNGTEKRRIKISKSICYIIFSR